MPGAEEGGHVLRRLEVGAALEADTEGAELVSVAEGRVLPLAHRSHLGGRVGGEEEGVAAMAMGRMVAMAMGRMVRMVAMGRMGRMAMVTLTSEESSPPESSTP